MRTLKKAIIYIILFLICAILIFIGCSSNSIILIFIGTIASAAMGSIISIIFESIDLDGQSIKLWFQHIKYYNKSIRLSFSYLFHIQIDGKYLLVKGNRLKNQYQPIGGVYKYYDEAKSTLGSFLFSPDVKMGNHNETDDLRINIKGKFLIEFMKWFLLMKDREYDPCREFREELIETGLLPENKFKIIKYRKIYVHNNGVQYSTFLDCNELLYADIFELKLTEEQKQVILKAVNDNCDLLCLASADEIKKECFNGINKNIGNNAKWLLGE